MVLRRPTRQFRPPVTGERFDGVAVETPEERATSQDLPDQDGHGRTRDEMGAGGGFHGLLHVAHDVEIVLGQAGVLEFVQEHDGGDIVVVGDPARQPQGLFFGGDYVLLEYSLDQSQRRLECLAEQGRIANRLQ